MSKCIFVTGTGTDVGKTYVSGLIIKKLAENGKNAAYYKAAVSGNMRVGERLITGDPVQVKKMSGIEQPEEEMCPYVYEAAISPHLASKIEGNPVKMGEILEKFDDICRKYSYITTEGSGGIVCPLRFDDEKIQLEDFIKARDLPCIIVADAGMGTINAVVLTADYMKNRNISVKAIIFNRYEPGNRLHEDNIFMCEQLTGLKVAACVKTGDTDLDIPFEALESFYEENRGDLK